MMGAIFSTTVPATIIRSDCRGVPRKTSAPNRARSWRESMTAIISMPQHARPHCIGPIDDRRAQLMTESSDVVRTLLSKRSTIPAIQPSVFSSGSDPPASGPVQRFALPNVEVPDHQDQEKNEHFDEAEQAEPVEHDRPGEEEDRLDVEDDEKNGDQEVADRKSGIQRQGGGLDAAFVRLELGRIRPAALEGTRDQDGREGKRRREERENENGKIVRHRSGIVSEGSGESNSAIDAARLHEHGNLLSHSGRIDETISAPLLRLGAREIEDSRLREKSSLADRPFTSQSLVLACRNELVPIDVGGQVLLPRPLQRIAAPAPTAMHGECPARPRERMVERASAMTVVEDDNSSTRKRPRERPVELGRARTNLPDLAGGERDSGARQPVRPTGRCGRGGPHESIVLDVNGELFETLFCSAHPRNGKRVVELVREDPAEDGPFGKLRGIGQDGDRTFREILSRGRAALDRSQP